MFNYYRWHDSDSDTSLDQLIGVEGEDPDDE